jgi:hypothetical protein
VACCESIPDTAVPCRPGIGIRRRGRSPRLYPREQRAVRVHGPTRHPSDVLCTFRYASYRPSTPYLIPRTLTSSLAVRPLQRHNPSGSQTRGTSSRLNFSLDTSDAHRVTQNMRLTRNDPPVVKVADFGLAKATDGLTMIRVRPSASGLFAIADRVSADTHNLPLK